MTAEISPLLARVVVVPTDPAYYFAAVLGVLGTQLLVWSIARDNTDTDWWRAAVLALLSVSLGYLALRLTGEGDLLGRAIPMVLGCAFAIRIISGWLYEELEIWQRITMGLGGAVIGVVAMLLGVLIRGLFVDSFGG